MGSKLSSMLVQQGFIPVKKLESALALQVIKGGQLDTILLEQGLASEASVTSLLARVKGFPPMEPGLLKAINPAVAAQITLERSEQLAICPVTTDGESVVMLVSERTDEVELEELAFNIGLRLHLFVAPEIRIQQARLILYGAPMDQRYEALLTRLGEVPPEPEPLADSAQAFIDPGRPEPQSPSTPVSAAPVEVQAEITEPGYAILDPLSPAEARSAQPPSTQLLDLPPAPVVEINLPLPTSRPSREVLEAMPPIPEDADEPASSATKTLELVLDLPDQDLIPDQEPYEEPHEEPAEEPHKKLAEEPHEEPAEEPAGEPVGELAEEPAEEPPTSEAQTEEAESTAAEPLERQPPEQPPFEAATALKEPPAEVVRASSSAHPWDSRTVTGEIETTTPDDAEDAPVGEVSRIEVEFPPEAAAPAEDDEQTRRRDTEDDLPQVVQVGLLEVEYPPDHPDGADPWAAIDATAPEPAEPEPAVEVVIAPRREAAATEAPPFDEDTERLQIPLGTAESDTPPDEEIALSLEAAVEAMRHAEDREQLLEALARGAALYVPAVQVYVLKQGTLRGHLSLRDGRLEREVIRTREVSMEVPSVVSRAVDSGSLYLGPTPDTDASAAVIHAAGIGPSDGLVLVPVVLRQKTICLLLGHQVSLPVPRQLRAPLTELANQAAVALAALILRAKQGAGRAADQRTAGTPPASHPTPSLSATSTPASEAEVVTSVTEPLPDSTPPASALTWQRATPRPSRWVVADDPSKRVICDIGFTPPPVRPERDEGARVIATLLEGIEQGGEVALDAEHSLRTLGKPAIEALIARFPGRLRFNRFASHSQIPPVTECSAVLRSLAAIGRPVLSSLAPLLRHPDAEIRFYATYLISELIVPEAVALLARQLLDKDSDVRRIAVRVLSRFREMPQFPVLVGELRNDLTHRDPRPRRGAVEALGALGDTQAIPGLVELLSDDDASVVEASRSALIHLTKQDFGLSERDWLLWWERNIHRRRLEWLIDGLDHKSPEVRASSGAELEELTGQSFGYRFDMPRKERAQVQTRYHDLLRQMTSGY